MTTQPIMSITDEQLTEIRDYYGEAESSLEILSTDDCQKVSSMAAELLLSRVRLREAEADAKRYRWLRDKSVDADGVFPMVSLTDDCGDQVSNWLFGQAVDKAVDAAMERTP